MLHTKKITFEQKEILSVLDDLDLLRCTLVHHIQDDTLFEYSGEHVSRLSWDIIGLYHQAIKPFHEIKFTNYMPGLYCFISAAPPEQTDDYLSYLDKLVQTQVFSVGQNSVLREAYAACHKSICKMREAQAVIDSFSLLHGDLHNGNILAYNGRYALIDFEYLRVGPSELEWAFLLFWDYITQPNIQLRRKLKEKTASDISAAYDTGILTAYQVFLIITLFLPAIVCAGIVGCIEETYRDSLQIQRSLEKFWTEEYADFFDLLKRITGESNLCHTR